jgi:hypothetical protein
MWNGHGRKGYSSIEPIKKVKYYLNNRRKKVHLKRELIASVKAPSPDFEG